MGSLERIGESRAEHVARDIAKLERRIDVERDTINRQGRALQYLGDTITAMACEHVALTGRVEKLETELTFRLLPFWRRWAVQLRYAGELAIAGWQRTLATVRTRDWSFDPDPTTIPDAYEDPGVPPDGAPADPDGPTGPPPLVYETETAGVRAAFDDPNKGAMVSTCERCGRTILVTESAEAELVERGALCEMYHCGNLFDCERAQAARNTFRVGATVNVISPARFRD